VVIQGFGNVGGMSAKLMSRAGFKIICIIEWDGAVYNARGLESGPDEASCRNRLDRRLSGGEEIDRHEAMFLETDVLIPAARKKSSPRRTRIAFARKFCARRERPTTHVADSILAEKGIFVIPDILAKRGRGVTVSYFEWVRTGRDILE